MALHDPRPLDANPDESAAPEGPRPLATFGRYLLFTRLKRDELGDVYRAGRSGAAAIERMVLLRLFNGPEIDGERFWQACRQRAEVQSALPGGPFARVVELGCEGGVPFVAHELIFGRSLADLLVQARDASEPVPLAHALYAMDRIAIALQNAYAARVGDERILHGFLIPDFVHVSSEGEIRLAGFESTGGLLDLSPAAPARARLAGYLAPEVRAGQPPTASDDIYSMAAILAELLTGEPTPALDASEAGRWLEAATLAPDASPVPDGIRRLLQASLAPRDERIQTADQWHQALTEIVAAGTRASTTFDLAFFVHMLFGDTLEREASLVEAEMQAEIPPPPSLDAAAAKAADAAEPEPIAEPEPEAAPVDESSPEPAPAEDAAGGAAAAGETFELPAEPVEPGRRSTTESKAQSAPAEPGSRKWIFVAAAALVLAGLGGSYFVFGRSGGSSEAPAPLEVAAAPRLDEPVTAPADAEPATVVTGISEVAPPLSPEELESQVRSLVAERAGDLEANLKAQYDQRLVELRRQLEEARKAASAPAPSTPAVAEPPAPTAAEGDSSAAPSPAAKLPAIAPAQPDPEPAAARTPAPPPAVAKPPAVPARDESARQPEPASPEEPVAAAAPEPPPVEAGAIVVNGPGVTAPTLIRQPNAVYPPAAARLKRQATVRVRILVDEQGRPSEIEQLGKKVGLGFDAAALQAARTTRWSPPEKDGVPVKMWVELSIDFRP